MSNELENWIKTLQSGDRFNLGAFRVTPEPDSKYRMNLAFNWEELDRVAKVEEVVKAILCHELGYMIDWSEGTIFNRKFWTENLGEAQRFMEYARCLGADFDVEVTTIPSIKGRGQTAQKFTFTNVRGGYQWQDTIAQLSQG